MESMLGNSNSDYPLFRLQKKVDFYESIGNKGRLRRGLGKECLV